MRALWLCAALVACDETAAEAPASSPPLEGTFTLEVRDSATLTIAPGSGGDSHVTIEPSARFGLLPEGALTGSGRIELLPEVGATLYTAKLSAPAQPDGPCGGEPVSLAMALHRQRESTTVIGGLSAYCGADTWFGRPVRVLRLAGTLPKSPSR